MFNGKRIKNWTEILYYIFIDTLCTGLSTVLLSVVLPSEKQHHTQILVTPQTNMPFIYIVSFYHDIYCLEEVIDINLDITIWNDSTVYRNKKIITQLYRLYFMTNSNTTDM